MNKVDENNLLRSNEFLLLLLYTIDFFHRRARVTFDTSETQKVFGPIVIDYHQVSHCSVLEGQDQSNMVCVVIVVQ